MIETIKYFVELNTSTVLDGHTIIEMAEENCMNGKITFEEYENILTIVDETKTDWSFQTVEENYLCVLHCEIAL